MEKFNGMDMNSSGIAVRYGAEPNSKALCLEILNEQNNDEKIKKIDYLIKILSKNYENNGFFAAEDTIYSNRLFLQGFKLDDKLIYYNFFDNLEKYISIGFKLSGAALRAIIETENNYFGNIANTAGMKKRAEISKITFNDNDDILVPSIKEFENANCGACVEFASVAHNLWLMTGLKSYYIISKNVKFQNDNSPDGHAFVIVENLKGKCMMFDAVNNNFEVLQKNPVKNMLNGVPFSSKGNCYANADKLKKEKEKQ